jgi:hypothetical protein
MSNYLQTKPVIGLSLPKAVKWRHARTVFAGAQYQRHTWLHNVFPLVNGELSQWMRASQRGNGSDSIGLFSSRATRRGSAWEERRYSSYSFLTLALDGVEWSASPPGRALSRGNARPLGTHCTGGWVGLRAGLDTEVRGKILCPCRGSNPDRPVVQSVVRHCTDWANPAPNIGLVPQIKYLYNAALPVLFFFLYLMLLRNEPQFSPMYRNATQGTKDISDKLKTNLPTLTL